GDAWVRRPRRRPGVARARAGSRNLTYSYEPMRVKLLVGGLAAAAVLAVVGFALAHEKSEPVGSSASSSAGSTACTQPTRPPAVHTPHWYTGHHAMVLVDSVLLGGMDALRRNLPRWHIVQVGHPA